MATLIDTSLWIDFTRRRSPRFLKRFIAPFILDPEAHVAEPVIFELLRNATAAEEKQLTQQLETLPRLSTPADIWIRAAKLGQRCQARKRTIGSLDLLIAVFGIEHDVEVITFDHDFLEIAGAAPLRVKLLERPTE